MTIHNVSVKTMLSIFAQLANSNVEFVNMNIEISPDGDSIGIYVPNDIPSEGNKLTTEIINKLIV